MNYIKDSSAVLCINTERIDSRETLIHVNGVIKIRSVNASNNKCSHNVVFYLYNDNANVKSDVSFCSFTNNEAVFDSLGTIGYQCLSFDYNSHLMRSCDVINNSQESNFGIIAIWNGAHLNIGSCCIVDNFG